MIFDFKSTFTAAAGALIIVSIGYSVDARPETSDDVKRFYGYPLTSGNPFSKNDLKIQKIFEPVDTSNSAVALFRGKTSIVTCIPKNEPVDSLYQKLLGRRIKDEANNIIEQGPTYSFDLYEKSATCYVTPYRCDKPIKAYGQELAKKYGSAAQWNDYAQFKESKKQFSETRFLDEENINAKGAAIIKKIKNLILATRKLGWNVNDNLEDVCINGNGEVISLVKYDKAYTLAFGGMRPNQIEGVAWRTNELTINIMSTFAVPKVQPFIKICIKDPAGYPNAWKSEKTICKFAREILVKSPVNFESEASHSDSLPPNYHSLSDPPPYTP
ncbi:hypothetical protein BDF19DRAFT_460827 [Syncephalis fuscata]|nr:hypothetical protein BDF19DRAFT_460827 [Syncephalis fuscata]